MDAQAQQVKPLPEALFLKEKRVERKNKQQKERIIYH
jgi:hypothetical protein